jgi:hypothetical protein
MVVKQFLGGMNGCFKPVHVEFGVSILNQQRMTCNQRIEKEKTSAVLPHSTETDGYSQGVLFSDFAGKKTDFEGWMTDKDFELICS